MRLSHLGEGIRINQYYQIHPFYDTVTQFPEKSTGLYFITYYINIAKLSRSDFTKWTKLKWLTWKMTVDKNFLKFFVCTCKAKPILRSFLKKYYNHWNHLRHWLRLTPILWSGGIIDSAFMHRLNMANFARCSWWQTDVDMMLIYM
jgi:hypothetical protein